MACIENFVNPRVIGPYWSNPFAPPANFLGSGDPTFFGFAEKMGHLPIEE